MGPVGRDLRSSVSLGEAMGTKTARSCRSALVKFLLESELLWKMSRGFEANASSPICVRLSPSNFRPPKEASGNADPSSAFECLPRPASHLGHQLLSGGVWTLEGVDCCVTEDAV